MPGRRPLEAPEPVGTETDRLVAVFRIGDVFDEHRWIESHRAARQRASTIRRDIDWRKGPVRSLSLGDHRFSVTATAVWVEVVVLGPVSASDFNKVRGVHDVPLVGDRIGEDGALVAPARQVLDRSRPFPEIRSAVALEPRKVTPHQLDGVDATVACGATRLGKMARRVERDGRVRHGGGTVATADTPSYSRSQQTRRSPWVPARRAAIRTWQQRVS